MKKDQDYNYQDLLNRRLKKRLIFFMVCLAMIFLFYAGRLFVIQIIRHQSYVDKTLSQYDQIISRVPTRGDITDRQGKMLASNLENIIFIYQPIQFESVDQRLEKAKRFVEFFNPSIETMAFRDQQEALLFYHPEVVKDLVNQESLRPDLSQNENHRLLLSLIDQSLIDQYLSQQELQVFSVFLKMDPSSSLNVTLKENVSMEEVNRLLENQHLFNGIRLAINWTRSLTKGHHLGPLVGTVSTSLIGLPKEKASYLQALDYKLNDRIGISGLEASYESLLSGVRYQTKRTYGHQKERKDEVVRQGRKGLTLVSTIDLDFQSFVEEKMANLLVEKAGTPYHKYAKEMYVVVSNPHNGDVLVSAGVIVGDDKKITYNPTGTYLNQYTVGSAIKGAVVYLALDEGLVEAGEKIMDEPIKIAGTQIKKSFRNLGLVDDIDALAYSSNVYMFHTAIRLGKGHYVYDQPLNLNPMAFHKMRANFSRFGLGVPTGLDVERESTGYKSNKTLPGYLLDYSIGQFETYTTMQLNQYISTIANGQYRYQMRLVKEGLDPDSGMVSFQNHPKILNTLDNDFAVGRVQEGMRACVTYGYCKSLHDLPFPVSAKTGSAEIYIYDDKGQLMTNEEGIPLQNTTNTIVGYGPSQDPKIAVSCIAPNYQNDVLQANGCELILKDIFMYYNDHPVQ